MDLALARELGRETRDIVGAVRKEFQEELARRDSQIAELREAIKALPIPDKGENGEPGRDGKDGLDGQSVDPEEIKAMVEEAVAAIPRPLDGKDGKDGAPGKDGIGVTDALIEREGALVLTLSDGRAKTLGKVIGRDGKDGKDGRDGKDGERGADGSDANIDALTDLAKRLSDGKKEFDPETLVSLIPKPEKGEPGKDGKDADPEEIKRMVNEAVEGIIKTIPAPKNGIDGKDGVDGKDGQSAYEIAVERGFEGSEIEWIESLKGADGAKGEKGIDGKDGLNGKDGKPGEKGLDGKDGIDGKDAISVQKSFVDQEGQLSIVYTDGREEKCGPVIGPSGKDGLGFDDLRLEFDGERSFSFVFERGDTRKEHGPFVMPAIIDRGIFRPGETYQQGDTVTWGGSLWTAIKETSDRPATNDCGWRLSVKKGLDGKPGKDGKSIKGEKGDPGRPGKDLTQIGPKGEKW